MLGLNVLIWFRRWNQDHVMVVAVKCSHCRWPLKPYYVVVTITLTKMYVVVTLCLQLKNNPKLKMYFLKVGILWFYNNQEKNLPLRFK